MDKQLELGTGGTGETELADTPAEKKAKDRAATRRRVQKFRLLNDPKKIVAAQGEALAALPEAEQQRLRDLHGPASKLASMMQECSGRIQAGMMSKSPEEDVPPNLYPDIVYLWLKEFIAGHPLRPRGVADEGLQRYGLQSGISQDSFDSFVEMADRWAQVYPDSCEAGVPAELRQLAAALGIGLIPRWMIDPLKNWNCPRAWHEEKRGHHDYKHNAAGEIVCEKCGDSNATLPVPTHKSQAEKYDFEQELSRYERERLANWNREIKERAQPIALFSSEIGGQQ